MNELVPLFRAVLNHSVVAFRTQFWSLMEFDLLGNQYLGQEMVGCCHHGASGWMQTVQSRDWLRCMLARSSLYVLGLGLGLGAGDESVVRSISRLYPTHLQLYIRFN